MKKLLVAACLALASVQAQAFNPFEKYLEEKVKDAAEEAVVDTVKDGLKGGEAKAKDKVDTKAKAATKKTAAKNGRNTPRVKAYLALPLTGLYRFAPPKGGDMKNLPTGPRGGYIDRFGNEWVPVTNKSKTAVLRWEEYLSEDGVFRLGRRAKGKTMLVLDREGVPIEPEGGKKL